MHFGVNKRVLPAVACALLAVVPLPGGAEELPSAPSPYLDRWIPSFALTGGATVQRHDSTATSTCGSDFERGGGRGSTEAEEADDEIFRSCLFLVNEGIKRTPLTPPQDNTDWAVSPTVGANLQLMTPGFEGIPGTPRLFAAAELVLTFPPVRDIAKAGDPGTIGIPGGSQNLADVDSRSLTGQGIKTTSEIQTLGFGASAGIAFPFQWRARRFWLKPSVAWLRYEVQVDGILVQALKNDRRNNTSNPGVPLNCKVPPPPVCTVAPIPGFGSALREVTMQGSDSRWFNGIGPSLELEMEVGRVGPFGVSLFAGGAAYRILGDREIAFSDQIPFGALPQIGGTGVDPITGDPVDEPGAVPTRRGLRTDQYDADWTFEVDPWEYRGILGLRFHWLGD